MAKKKKPKAPRKKNPRSKKISSRKKNLSPRKHRSKSPIEKAGWMGLEGAQLGFTTKDPHALAFFYRDTLGFPMGGSQRQGSAHKPGFSYSDESRGVLSLQTMRDLSVHFQDYNLAYHWVAQLGGRPPEEPLSAQIFLLVRDVDRVYERLLKKGVQFFSPPREMPWGLRIVECADPEGRRIVFAEVRKRKR